MQRAYVFGTMLALALTGSVYAQQDQSAASSSAQKDREVTVTGCLVPGAPSAATTAGTTGTAGSATTSSADKFTLANATITSGPGATTTTTGTAGTSGTTASAAPGPSYNLIGGQKSDLEPNLNSKVEIRGVLEPASASSPSAAAGTMTGGTSGATGAAAAKQLRVTSVRQLASSCGGGQ